MASFSTDNKRTRIARFFYHGARWILGAIFIYASYDKILHPITFADIVYNYQLLPDVLINITAIVLPWLELVIGCCLIAGLWMPGTVAWSNILLVSYTSALTYNFWRGLDINCGCFSTTQGSPIGVESVIWDVAFLLISVYLLIYVFGSRTRGGSK